MAEIRIKKRRRLRNKEVRALGSELSQRMGVEVFPPETIVDIAQTSDFEVLFVDGQILAIVYEGQAFPTVRGLLRWGAEKHFVTVDMGAVPYVYNGADVMAPGIVEVDPDIREGDLVWIRDEKNGQPLAIGRALLPAKFMLDKKSGKAVASIHHVGDKLWKIDEE
jgi:PUA-domain protein